MAKKCVVTGKQGIVGGGYSNRTRATKFNPTGKVRKRANIQKRRLFVPSLGKTVTLMLSAKGLRVLKKRGVEKSIANLS